jgi:DNA-binding PadR family transcriptional regulator
MNKKKLQNTEWLSKALKGEIFLSYHLHKILEKEGYLVSEDEKVVEGRGRPRKTFKPSDKATEFLKALEQAE